MTPEQIKKEDIELFQLDNHIQCLTDDYNRRMKRLDEIRPSPFASCSPSKFDSGSPGVCGIKLVRVSINKFQG